MANKPNHERTMEEKIKYFKSAPFDARFVQTNQARNCFQNYIDYHRCNSVMDAKGKDNHACTFFKLCYADLCPDSWVEKWNDQVDEGTFPAKISVWTQQQHFILTFSLFKTTLNIFFTNDISFFYLIFYSKLTSHEFCC